jgi:poly(3-hydroxybutyrate) depolymerase
LKRSSAIAVLCCAFLLAVPALAKVKVTRSVFEFNYNSRTFYWYAPDTTGPLPLVVLLHGSGRDGAVMAEAWKDLAAREHFMIAAPDSFNSALWDSSYDSPQFLHAVVDQVRAVHPVDDSRIYLFGHSGGAVYALALALIDSDYFAAVAVHAGTLRTENYGLFPQATRQMPIGIWVGSLDQNFPVADVTETKRAFDAHGFHLELHVLQGQTHNYDNFSEEIDSKAWGFLKDKRLSP